LLISYEVEEVFETEVLRFSLTGSNLPSGAMSRMNLEGNQINVHLGGHVTLGD
jgi:hypothetical protein